MGSITSIGEIDLFDKKLIKVVDVLGRETSINSNETLFFIYEDGTIEKRYIIDFYEIHNVSLCEKQK